MAGKRRKKNRRNRRLRLCLAAGAVALILLAGAAIAQVLESRMSVKVDNAGKQMTAFSSEENAAQVFMNDQWYKKKDVETLLVMGVDNHGSITSSDSYNNSGRADFLMLFVRDTDSGEQAAIHLNRDTMTDITMLGVTGEAAGVQRAQLALAFTYGRGEGDSSRNTADAVSNLLYGMEIDHYITITMDAVPIMNDWAGGVEVEILDDFTGVDETLVQGEKITLSGEHALNYVQTRKGLDDSSNLQRMKRQRQYAAAWIAKAQNLVQDEKAVANLVLQLSNYHYSDCSAEELAEIARRLSDKADMTIYDLDGKAVQGVDFMEYYVDDEMIQQLVLELFYSPVKD